MSTSTIYITKPSSYRQSLIQLKEKYKEYSPLLSFFLWTFSGLYAASKTNFSPNITGLTVSFAVQDLVMMSLTSFLLYQGLTQKNTLLLIPWMGMTTYSLYANHYLGILNTITTLKKVTKTSWLPWVNIGINILLLVIRLTLTIRVFQLCVNLWIKQKINEMKKRLST